MPEFSAETPWWGVVAVLGGYVFLKIVEGLVIPAFRFVLDTARRKAAQAVPTIVSPPEDDDEDLDHERRRGMGTLRMRVRRTEKKVEHLSKQQDDHAKGLSRLEGKVDAIAESHKELNGTAKRLALSADKLDKLFRGEDE